MPLRKLDKFASEYPAKNFAAGDAILHQGDEVKSIYIIRDGVVKVFDINKEGEEKTVVYDSKDEVFPISYVYTGVKYSLYYYEAYTPTRLTIVPTDEYHKFLQANSDVMYFYLSTMAQRYLDFARRVNSLEQLKAEDKILYSLDFLSRRFGDRRNPSKVTVNIPLSQQEFANFVGLTRETVSGVMGKLRKKGVIQYGAGKGLILNINKISDLMEL